MERRRYTRITVNIPVILHLYQLEACHAGIIANISEGGCFFPITDDIPLGATCELTITIGPGLDAESLTLTGEVVRREAGGIGIRFLENPLAKNPRFSDLVAEYRQE